MLKEWHNVCRWQCTWMSIMMTWCTFLSVRTVVISEVVVFSWHHQYQNGSVKKRVIQSLYVYGIYEWVGGVSCPTWHITGDFGDEPFQAIYCAGTDNWTHNHHKVNIQKTNRDTNKLATVKKKAQNTMHKPTYSSSASTTYTWVLTTHHNHGTVLITFPVIL